MMMTRTGRDTRGPWSSSDQTRVSHEVYDILGTSDLTMPW